MEAKNYKNWNEFEWERELRRDDLRINTYMRSLPEFIDLPGEDDLLIKKLRKIPELMPHEFHDWTDTPYATVFSDAETEEMEEWAEDIFLSGKWKEEDNADILIICRNLTKRWIYSLTDDKYQDRKAALKILGLLGLEMSILVDIIQIRNHNVPGLVIALSKRAVQHINTLTSELKNILKKQPLLKENINEYIIQLHEIREKLTDIIFKTKEEAKKK